VIRGGSFFNSARNARSAYRNRNHPGNRRDNLGFRPASPSQGQIVAVHRPLPGIAAPCG
jgi:hypothetical protein